MQGGCYCGDCRYEVTGKPVLKAQCHCRECQYLTGGGPNYFMTVPSDSVAVTQGQTATFKRDDLDAPRLREFCPRCGTHLFTHIRERGLTVVKIGTLDDPATDYGGPKAAIYTCDLPPYHEIPEGLPSFDKLPPAR